MSGLRKLAAEHCHQKSLSYFHSGAWYSIFDHEARAAADNVCLAVDERGSLPEEELWRRETPFAGPELDGLDGFGRNFIPVKHTHLTSGGASVDGSNIVYELLPWLELAIRFDPTLEQAYVDADYWLRNQLKRPGEAESLLMRGLRANPDSYQLTFLLGEIAEDHHDDTPRARRIWNRSLRLWEEKNARVDEPDVEAFRRIAGRLARLEERNGRLAVAKELVLRLRPVAVRPQSMNRWLTEINAGLAFNSRHAGRAATATPDIP